MFQIVILDRSAEARNLLVERFNAIVTEGSRQFNFFPQVSLKPLSFEELKFHGTPDLVIIGHETATNDSAQIAQVRETLPDVRIMVELDCGLDLAAIEHLARLGADEFYAVDLPQSEFLRKIVLLSKRNKHRTQGKLIVVLSGKGGAGVTTIAGSLGEVLLNHEKSSCLIDFDYETQDLTRFMQARPFVNDNLQLLVEKQKIISEESVRGCISQIWLDEPKLTIIPPPPEISMERGSDLCRHYLEIFEKLDVLYDCLIVDAGAARGELREMLLRVADHVLYVIPNDAAALYASLDGIKKIRNLLAQEATLSVLINRLSPYGLTAKALHEELSVMESLQGVTIMEESLPLSKEGSRWAGSGQTFVALAGQESEKVIVHYLNHCSLIAAGVEKVSPVAAPSATKKALLTAFNAAKTKLLSYHKKEPALKLTFARDLATTLALPAPVKEELVIETNQMQPKETVEENPTATPLISGASIN